MKTFHNIKSKRPINFPLTATVMIAQRFYPTLFNYSLDKDTTLEQYMNLLVKIILHLEKNYPIIYGYLFALLSEVYTEKAIKDLLIKNNLEFKKELEKKETGLLLEYKNWALSLVYYLSECLKQSKIETISASEIDQFYMENIKRDFIALEYLLLLFHIVSQDSSKPLPINFLAFLSLLSKQTKNQIINYFFTNFPNSHFKQEFILAMSKPNDLISLEDFCKDAYCFICLTKIENKLSSEVSDLISLTSFNEPKKNQLLNIIQASNTVREWSNNHTIIKVVEELSGDSNYSLEEAHMQLAQLLSNIKLKSVNLHSYFHQILSQIYLEKSLNQVELTIISTDYKPNSKLTMVKNYCVYSLMKIIGRFYKSKENIQLSLLEKQPYFTYFNEIKRVLPEIHQNLFRLFLALKPQSFFDSFIWYMPILFPNDNIQEILQRLSSDIKFKEFDQLYLKGITPPNNLDTLNTYYLDIQYLVQIHNMTDLNIIEQFLHKTSLKEEEKKQQLMEIMNKNKITIENVLAKINQTNIDDALEKLREKNINIYNKQQEKKDKKQREIEEIVKRVEEKIVKRVEEKIKEQEITPLKNSLEEMQKNIEKLEKKISTISSENQDLLKQKKSFGQNLDYIVIRDQINRIVDYLNENWKEIYKYSKIEENKKKDFVDVERKNYYQEFINIFYDLNALKEHGNLLAHPKLWANFYEKLCLIDSDFTIHSLKSIKILCDTPSFKQYFNIESNEQAKPTFARFYDEYKQCQEEDSQKFMKVMKNK